MFISRVWCRCVKIVARVCMLQCVVFIHVVRGLYFIAWHVKFVSHACALSVCMHIDSLCQFSIVNFFILFHLLFDIFE